MRFKVEASSFRAATDEIARDMAKAASLAMADVVDDVRDDWRDAVVRAGLGKRLANTVRGRAFPDPGRASLDPAGWVYSKAPTLMDVYSRGATVLPTDGRRYLAIPTRNVPRAGRVRMTPLEVEVAFNQDLIVVPGKSGNLLAFVDALKGRRAGTFRAPTARRLAQGRQRKLVLMFTLVRQVRIRRRFSLEVLAARGAGYFGPYLKARLAALPDRPAGPRVRR